MAKYDFKSAKRYIQMHSDVIDSASMGMHEDWFWTAEVVYEDGRFNINLDDDNLKIGGISGSDWATPKLEVELKDGNTLIKDCFIGEVGGQKPEWFVLGCLSQPVQNEREGVNLIGGDA